MPHTQDPTTQINFRLPSLVKQKAMEKAEALGTNLNHIMKVFLIKFANDDKIAKVNYDFSFDALFDQAIIEYTDSKVGKLQAKKLMETLKKKGIIS